MLKELLRTALDDALSRLHEQNDAGEAGAIEYQIEVPKQSAHGDFSTNLAMLLARPLRRPPRDIAAELTALLTDSDTFAAVDVAGPGFINFTLSDSALFDTIDLVLAGGSEYGRNNSGADHTIQVEFVSANPTGPLHIGHGRGAAIGSAIAALLELNGYRVEREYYVNDAGRQIDILATSVYLRLLSRSGVDIAYPEQAYQGDYIGDIAGELLNANSATWNADGQAPLPGHTESDPERAMDATIAAVKSTLGDERYDVLRRHAVDVILGGIRSDLEAFGVSFDAWFSEASLVDSGAIDDALAVLESADLLYRDNGALWFRTTAFGDEKDRVVERENGQRTYFASDIAYHLDKIRRGYAAVVDVWGADHHGYVPRVRAAISALGRDADTLDVVLVQFATLVRAGVKVAMSTRSGEFVTLRQLVDEVGVDAARFFYVMRRADQHLEFDLELATSKSNDNPVYYVQYAHARICSVYRQLEERGWRAPEGPVVYAGQLTAEAERRIAILLARYPEVIATAGAAREPHLLTNYLRDLATEFHAYYNGHKFLLEDADLRAARLRLIRAVQQVIHNGLTALAVSAPETM